MARHRLFCTVVFVLIFVLTLILLPQSTLAADAAASGSDPLVQVLVEKGVLTAEEGQAISQAAPAQQHDRLLMLLRDKGVISTEEFTKLAPASAQVSPDPGSIDYRDGAGGGRTAEGRSCQTGSPHVHSGDRPDSRAAA